MNRCLSQGACKDIRSLGITVAFSVTGALSAQRGVGMKLRVRAIGLAVAMFVSTSVALAPRVLAQEAAPDAVKRKVKTRVVPDFPPLARQMNVTGKVKIEVTISPDGRVSGTKVVGGSPVLVGAALDAIKRWRFEAAPKETTEIIEFSFN